MRRTWDVVRILVVWLACVCFVRSRVVLYILYIWVGRGRRLLTAPESPAHGACQPDDVGLQCGCNFETRGASHVRLGLGFEV